MTSEISNTKHQVLLDAKEQEKEKRVHDNEIKNHIEGLQICVIIKQISIFQHLLCGIPSLLDSAVIQFPSSIAHFILSWLADRSSIR